jgi:WhiB family redox-sensing transcriptional regulator
VTTPDWMRDAACRGVPTEIFYRPAGGHHQARRICETCPVREECARHAVIRPEPFGYWGMMTERARRLATGRLAREGVVPINPSTRIQDRPHSVICECSTSRPDGSGTCTRCWKPCVHRMSKTAQARILEARPDLAEQKVRGVRAG